ncbi:MAG: amino acid permease [Kiritimatiellae bacterium]|nr:amino acid permease [Kiritimatiellia bacterium]
MPAPTRRELSPADAAALIVGVIIGVGIFQVAPDVARGTPSGAAMLGLWVAGAALSWCGATVYAQLAAALPEAAGGDYAYLTRAYGRWAGFLFAWLLTVVVRPGDIAVMAFAFATYASALARGLWPGSDVPPSVLAAGAIGLLTAVHAAGVRAGVRAQNVLTAVKVLGLIAVAVLAWAAPPVREVTSAAPRLPTAVALILVLFTYGGWNEIAYVAAEVREPARSVPRALAGGLGGVAALYVLANAGFLRALGGHAGVATAEAVAAAAVERARPGAGGWVSALIAVSALGAVHGLIFTGARIPAAAGGDHALLAPLARWSPRTHTPVRALLLQGAMALGLVLVLGSFVEVLLYTAVPVYSFQLATALALPRLRRREPTRWAAVPRWGHPWTTATFAAACAFLIWRAALYRPWTALGAVAIAALGVPAWRWSERRRASPIASTGGGNAP